MTPAQHRILVVGNRESARVRLEEAIRVPSLDVHQAHTYSDAMVALSLENFAVAVIDLWTDDAAGAVPVTDRNTDGTHDGLEVIIEAARRDVRLVIISEPLVLESLQNTPGVSRDAVFLDRGLLNLPKLSNRILDLLSGHIDSENGMRARGATVFFRPGAPVAPPPVGSRPGKPRILIVEDQTFWQDTLSRLLEEVEYFWRIAHSPDQAIARLQLESFHIVLYNLTLGDPNQRERAGWKFLDYLVERESKTRLIIITGSLSSGEVARLFMGYPVKGFVDKNAFNRDDLLNLIQQQMAGPMVKIQTLGDFRLWRDGKLVNAFPHLLTEKTLKLLIARAGENVPVDELIQVLWPGADRKTQYATLGEIINSVRMALEPDLPRASDSRLVLRDGAYYRLDVAANIDIDSEMLRHFAEKGRSHELESEFPQAMNAYQAVRALYQGDFLPGDRAEPWTFKARTALQMLYTDSLNRLADLFALQGQLNDALTCAHEALQADAYIEGTYRRLMRYHACKGDRSAALSVYKALVKLFSEFMGEAPSHQTQQLQQDILDGKAVDCVDARSGTWRFDKEST